MSQPHDLELDRWNSRWRLFSSLIFGLVAVAIKLIFFPTPYFAIPALFIFLASFLPVMLFWRFVVPSGVVKLRRAVVVGAMIGLLIPMLMWLLYAPYLWLTAARPWEAIGWSFAYMLVYPLFIGWLTVPLSILLAFIMAYFQRQHHLLATA